MSIDARIRTGGSMAASQPEVRSMVARIAANSRWAREFHRKEATAAARRGFYRRFEREVDPDRCSRPTSGRSASPTR
jgi:hypothetical protein